MMPQALALAALLTLAAKAQSFDDIVPDELRDQEDDPRLDDNWPRYTTTEIDLIPKGATVNNEMGFWLTADYSTVEQLTGELSFELNMTLHNPKQENNWIYMIWLQAIDPILTNPSRNFYEGFSCAIRYDESLGTEIRSNYLYRIGYRGVRTLQYAEGRHDELFFVEEEQTDQYPWLVNEDKTSIKRDDKEEIFTETCSITRDFLTTYSNIPLKAKEKFEVNVGYKVYRSPTYIMPLYKGHKLNMEWVIAETPEAAINSLALSSAALLSTVLLTSFW